MFEVVRLESTGATSGEESLWHCYFVTYLWQQQGLDRGAASAEVRKQGGPLSRIEDIGEIFKKLKAGVVGAEVVAITTIFPLGISPE